MRTFMLVALLATVAVLSGCASDAPKPDANYSAYLDLVQKQQQAADEQRTAFATMAQKCTSDACVTQVAAISALAANGERSAPPQQFVPHESLGAKMALALVGQISPLAAAAVSWHQSDVSKDVSVAQFGFLGGAIHDLSGTVAGMTPSINVGGDYVPGTYVAGDLTNGNKISNSGVFNTGTIDRYYSPSNDPSATGSGCAGATTCQTAPPVTPPTTPTP